MKLGQRERAVEIDPVSTGSLGLDPALGVGGLPRGRIVEIYGPESFDPYEKPPGARAECRRPMRRREHAAT
jgi:hypothetical protein